jgi:hypothetical protein
LGTSPIQVWPKASRSIRNEGSFGYAVELEGFPVVHFEWVPVCHTAGALLLPSFVSRPGHDLVVILLNGLVTPDELRSITERFPLRAEIWQHVMSIEKPVAIGALYTVGRVREPATVTVINAFANSFFSLFGTNEVDEQVRRPGK